MVQYIMRQVIRGIYHPHKRKIVQAKKITMLKNLKKRKQRKFMMTKIA